MTYREHINDIIHDVTVRRWIQSGRATTNTTPHTCTDCGRTGISWCLPVCYQCAKATLLRDKR